MVWHYLLYWLATGLIATVLALNPHLVQFNWDNLSSFLSSSSKAKVLEVGEFPVNILETSQIPNLSKGKSEGKGENLAQSNIQNAFFMAPKGEGGSWVKKAGIPTARTCFATSAVDGKIYAIGGFGILSIVEGYDPATDTWTRKADMPTARWWLSTSVVDEKIYAIGGSTVSYTVILPTVEEYTPEGWSFAVSPNGKLPNTWGKIKAK